MVYFHICTLTGSAPPVCAGHLFPPQKSHYAVGKWSSWRLLGLHSTRHGLFPSHGLLMRNDSKQLCPDMLSEVHICQGGDKFLLHSQPLSFAMNNMYCATVSLLLSNLLFLPMHVGASQAFESLDHALDGSIC